MATDREVFCRAVRARSYEHKEAIELLIRGGVTSQVISILRQELDSMVRIIYLLQLNDSIYRNRLIKDTLIGKQWRHKGSSKKVTDRDMVDVANTLHGWTKSVYAFGCAFIHLSNLHDYNDTELFDLISTEDRNSIVTHMNRYHGSLTGVGVRFRELIPYLPMVFDKIASNLECEVQSLEKLPK